MSEEESKYTVTISQDIIPKTDNLTYRLPKNKEVSVGSDSHCEIKSLDDTVKDFYELLETIFGILITILNSVLFLGLNHQ